ncbi:MAG: hypothetical protein JNM18_07510 [Planctomycetaceae bacterium]|nr:hypothetical protein [Planctomycetaceae bacterium]
MLAVDLHFSAPTLVEAAGTAVLTATVETASAQPIQVNLSLKGTAIANQDYRISPATITIPSGQLSGSVTISGIEDSRSETDELIEAHIASVMGTTEQWTGQPAYLTIMDNYDPLTIAGTAGNDTLVVVLGAKSFDYRLNNDKTITVDYAQSSSLRFSDNVDAGLDTILLYLNATGSYVSLKKDSITIEGATPFDLWNDNIEKQYINGTAKDTAFIEGTTGNDTYWGRPSYSVLTAGNLLAQVSGIRKVSVNGHGGIDSAYLYGNGTTSVDSFVAGAFESVFYKQSRIKGDKTLDFRNSVSGFRYVSAYADDVRDTATLQDVEHEDDSLFANASLARMNGTRNSLYQNTAVMFRAVRAISRGGNDTATLNDSPGVDYLVANNVRARIAYAGKGFVEASGFRDVIANSPWNFTYDIVALSDSWIADIDNTSSHIQERTRDDYLNIKRGTVQMIYGNRSVLVQGFESLSAHATNGGLDTYTIETTWFTRASITGFVSEYALGSALISQLQTTRAYLRNSNWFDVRRYTRRGTDSLNPEFSDVASRLREEWADAFPNAGPLTAGNVSQVSALMIYDFSRLETVERRLANIIRRSVFQRLFDEITRNARNNVERQTAIIEFGHKSVRHTELIQPLSYDLGERARSGRFIYNGRGVADPLVLIELAEGRCGQVNKLNADLWHALGFRVRLLAVNSHTSGEVYYERQWHFNDSGAFGGGDVPLMPISPGSATQKIPSFEEMRSSPDIVDLLPFYVGAYSGNQFPLGTSPLYASTAYFDNLGDSYYYAEKNAAADANAQNSRYYGWEYYTITPATWVNRVPRVDFGTQPSPAYINAVSVTGNGSLGGTATIGWQASFDNLRQRLDSKGNPVLDANGHNILDWQSPTGSQAIYSDVVGYRVFVSTTSRGWNYNEYQGTDSVAPAVKAFKASNALWTPAMYDARYTPAPRDVMSVFVPAKSTTLGGQEQVQLQLPGSGTYYVSIMAVDARGLAIGKTNYMLSEEIKITI